ncbi:unnamed protein product [Ilex paraguariensis]|uniref:MLO-like protein n=1 Tax=Ilex paraguariensis TaxID=185542 RepID=A0ABC8T605_9AQUA
MAAGDSSGSSLEYTPTWAFATLCFVIISISLSLVHSIHLLATWLKKRQKIALNDAVDKLKSGAIILMLLGFMSLLLAVTQESISKICVSKKIADIMLPCRKEITTTAQNNTVKDYEDFSVGVIKFSLLVGGSYNSSSWIRQRQLAITAIPLDSCSSKGKVSLMSQTGIHQLHIFIFVLAIMQIVYSVLTMALGGAKMRSWKAWEKETQTIEYQVANDPNRFRFTRQTTFGRRHMTICTESSVQLWMIADIMLPCRKEITTTAQNNTVKDYEDFSVGVIKFSLLVGGSYNSSSWIRQRQLAITAVPLDSCSSKGKVSLMSQTGIHQLHIFIFVLAIMQIVYSVLTMALGGAKMRSWKAWEKETQTIEYQVANDPNRFRFTRQTTFGRRHMTICTESSVQLWMVHVTRNRRPIMSHDGPTSHVETHG